jgi:hypothetical protein
MIPVNYITLTQEQRKIVREQYVKEQNNKCIYCNCSLDKLPPQEILDKKINWSIFPKNFLKYPIHLQHNHNTGMTEGAVHNRCNAILWQYHKR